MRWTPVAPLAVSLPNSFTSAPILAGPVLAAAVLALGTDPSVTAAALARLSSGSAT